MNLRSRLAKVERVLSNRPKPDQIDILQIIRAGSRGAEGRLPGEYQTGSVVDLVYEGEKPEPAVLARLHSRMPSWALTISFGLEVVPPPLTPAEKL